MVNVVDLMCLSPADVHPHGLPEERFLQLFTADRPVVFGFHGYQRAVHAIVHGRPRAERFHVRGFMEEGTTTTPFDMVVKNEASRFHICLEALRRAPHVEAGAFIAWCNEMLTKHAVYIREHGEDLPEIRGWAWTDPMSILVPERRRSSSSRSSGLIRRSATTALTSGPIAAVTAIASPPPRVTRSVARSMGAPPSAPKAPSRGRRSRTEAYGTGGHNAKRSVPVRSPLPSAGEG